MPRLSLLSMEYIDGVLIISYIHPQWGSTTEFIKWADVHSIQFNDTVWPDLRFPHLPEITF